MVGSVGVGEAWVVVLRVEEDLEGEVRVVLARDEGREAIGVEALGPGFDWWGDGVGLEEGGVEIGGGGGGGDSGGNGGGEWAGMEMIAAVVEDVSGMGHRGELETEVFRFCPHSAGMFQSFELALFL